MENGKVFNPQRRMIDIQTFLMMKDKLFFQLAQPLYYL
jgi:hypothetical protein